MVVVPWNPLAGGFLTGKYRREDTGGSGRLSGANPFGDSKFVDRSWDVLAVLEAVAAEIGCPPPEAALAWVMRVPVSLPPSSAQASCCSSPATLPPPGSR